jgi:hypothetical protein
MSGDASPGVPGHCFTFRIQRQPRSYQAQTEHLIQGRTLGECAIYIDNVIHPERSESLVLKDDVATFSYKEFLANGGTGKMRLWDLDWTSWSSTHLSRQQRFRSEHHLIQYKAKRENGGDEDGFKTMLNDSWSAWIGAVNEMASDGITDHCFNFRIIRNPESPKKTPVVREVTIQGFPRDLSRKEL